ncbi:MAG: hypothetical protein IPP69_11415 [Flavobacteriales bacterium]|nr:hypothetical protein [Flavobacteriales bacterium]
MVANSAEIRRLDTVRQKIYNNVIYDTVRNVFHENITHDSTSWLVHRILVNDTLSKVFIDTLNRPVLASGLERIVVVENKPEETILSLSTLISIAAAIVSILALWFTWSTHRKSARAAITKEFIDLNSITISNPFLKIIYSAKSKAESEIDLIAHIESANNVSPILGHKQHAKDQINEKLKSYCYKYLNLLDMINNEYRFMNKPYYKRRVVKRDYEIKWWYRRRKKERLEWINFYANNFRNHECSCNRRERTKGYLLIKEILKNARRNGAYSDNFIEFTCSLLRIKT